MKGIWTICKTIATSHLSSCINTYIFNKYCFHFHFKFFSRTSKWVHMKDSMTLPVLVRNIQKAHTPAPDIHMIDIFDTKNWIKPFVNKIKIMCIQVIKRSFLDGPSQRVLNSRPQGIPSLVSPDTKTLLLIKDLEEWSESVNIWHKYTSNGCPPLPSPRKHSLRNGKLLLPNFSVRVKEQSGTSTQ